jgi:hypothetical protein
MIAIITVGSCSLVAALSACVHAAAIARCLASGTRASHTEGLRARSEAREKGKALWVCCFRVAEVDGISREGQAREGKEKS